MLLKLPIFVSLALLLIALLPTDHSRAQAPTASRHLGVCTTEPAPVIDTLPKGRDWSPEVLLARSRDGSRLLLGGWADSGDRGLGSSFYATHLLDVPGARSLWSRADANGGEFLPDGRLLFWGYDDGEGELGLFSVADGKVLFVYPSARVGNAREELAETTASWNARTGEIAFSRTSGPHSPSVYALRARDRRVRYLTRGHSPLWSPDSSLLLTTAPRDPKHSGGTLWITRGDGPGRRMLGVGRALAWLPSSRAILAWRRFPKLPPPAGQTAEQKAQVLKEWERSFALYRIEIEPCRWRPLGTVRWDTGQQRSPRTTSLSPSGAWLCFTFEEHVILLRTLDGATFTLPIDSQALPFWGTSDRELYYRANTGWRLARLAPAGPA